MQKAYAQPLFQTRYLSTHAGLGKIQRPGCSRKAPRLHYFDKNLDIVQIGFCCYHGNIMSPNLYLVKPEQPKYNSVTEEKHEQ